MISRPDGVEIELGEAEALRVRVPARQLEDDDYLLVKRIINARISRRGSCDTFPYPEPQPRECLAWHRRTVDSPQGVRVETAARATLTLGNRFL